MNNPNVATSYSSHTVQELLEISAKGQLNMDPDYQRNVVWAKNKKREFIKSLILACPIPSLMLSLDTNHVYNVLDGKQRLTTMISFVKNEFTTRMLHTSRTVPFCPVKNGLPEVS